jgi:oligopeptide transport system substrate-binding protein
LKRLWCGLLLAAATTLHAAPRILERGNGNEPESLDPHAARADAAFIIIRDLYEGLMTTGPDAKLEPGQAERWEVSKDGLTYTFHLRANAKWSNGDPVTAEDFVHGFRRAVDPRTASPYAQSLAPLVNAEDITAGRKPATTLGAVAVDARTLKISLRAPTPYLLSLLTHASTWPVHRPTLAKHGERFMRPGNAVTNGAYRLKDWVPHSYVLLERNRHYWNDKATRIDQVRYHPIDDENAEFNRYRAGELDITYTIPHRQFAFARKELGKEMRVTPYLAIYFHGINLTKPPFKDQPGLRRALSMVIDRDVLVDKVTAAGEVAAWGFVPPGTAGHTAQRFDYAAWPVAKRVAEAQKLYAAAGYSRAKPLTVEVRHNTGDNHKRVALAIAAMWKQHLGVETRVVNEEWQVFLQNRRAQQVTQVYRSGWNGDYDDAMTFLELGRSTHPINDFGWRKPAYDALLDRIGATLDPKARVALQADAENMLLADHPVLPLYFYVSKHLVKPRVIGWQDNVMDFHPTRQLGLR